MPATTSAPDNSRCRAAMQAFVDDPTKEAGKQLVLTLVLEHFAVLVPMADGPEDESIFTSVVDTRPHPSLHVYTSVEELPELEEDVRVMIFPFAELVMELIQGEERWNGIIVDPDAPHSITQYFPSTGGHAIYSTAELRKALERVDPGLN